MLRFYAFLISALLSSAVSAQGYVSGSFSATLFSNPDYYKPLTDLTVNGSYRLNNNITFRGTLSLEQDRMYVERAHVDFTNDGFFGTEYSIKLGRYARINALYNDVTDNPSTSALAHLPPATYLPMILESKITLADGIHTEIRKRVDDGVVTLKIAVGTGADGNKSVTNQMMLDRNTQYSVSPVQWGAKDVALIYTDHDFTSYVGHSEFPYHTTMPGMPLVLQDSNRAGASWYLGDWTIEGEISSVIVHAMSPAGTPIANYSFVGGSTTVKYTIDDRWLVYTTYSKYKSEYNTQFETIAVGATVDFEPLSTISVEVMQGNGNRLSSLDSTKPSWSSIVFSYTRRF